MIEHEYAKTPHKNDPLLEDPAIRTILITLEFCHLLDAFNTTTILEGRQRTRVDEIITIWGTILTDEHLALARADIERGIEEMIRNHWALPSLLTENGYELRWPGRDAQWLLLEELRRRRT